MVINGWQSHGAGRGWSAATDAELAFSISMIKGDAEIAFSRPCIRAGPRRPRPRPPLPLIQPHPSFRVRVPLGPTRSTWHRREFKTVPAPSSLALLAQKKRSAPHRVSLALDQPHGDSRMKDHMADILIPSSARAHGGPFSHDHSLSPSPLLPSPDGFVATMRLVWNGDRPSERAGGWVRRRTTIKEFPRGRARASAQRL